MVIFILTHDGFLDMQHFIDDKSAAIWVNKNVLNKDELNNYRNAGLEITDFTNWINPKKDEEILKSINIIANHHPNSRIWIEIQSET